MASPKKGPTSDDSYVKALLDEAAKRAPEPYKGYIVKASPTLIGIADAFDRAWPYIVAAYEWCVATWAKIEPYHPEQYIPIIAGFVMCFFGGSFLLLVSAVEAARISGWDQLAWSVKSLVNNAKRGLQAKRRDDSVDADGDGVADVLQISKKERLSRMIVVVGGAINPDECSNALTALWTVMLSIIATLRVRFAQCLTLGSTLAGLVQKHIGAPCEKFVTEILPPELKKWSPKVVQYGFAFFGFLCAWMLQRAIGGFHAAIRGGQMLTLNGLRLAKARGYVSDDFAEDSKQVSIAAVAIGIFGFAWQLQNGFAVPFPLNLIFLPASIAEWLLAVFVAF